MDIKRKKELLNEWKNRHPEIGVFIIKCKTTGDIFAGISKDTQVEFNSQRFRLSSKLHSNKDLSKLWEEYGENNFEYVVEKVLKYENPNDDYTKELEELLEKYLLDKPQARRIGK